MKLFHFGLLNDLSCFLVWAIHRTTAGIRYIMPSQTMTTTGKTEHRKYAEKKLLNFVFIFFSLTQNQRAQEEMNFFSFSFPISPFFLFCFLPSRRVGICPFDDLLFKFTLLFSSTAEKFLLSSSVGEKWSLRERKKTMKLMPNRNFHYGYFKNTCDMRQQQQLKKLWKLFNNCLQGRLHTWWRNCEVELHYSAMAVCHVRHRRLVRMSCSTHEDPSTHYTPYMRWWCHVEGKSLHFLH